MEGSREKDRQRKTKENDIHKEIERGTEEWRDRREKERGNFQKVMQKEHEQ